MSRTPESVDSISPGTPRQLDHVLERCLAKDPDERWQTASDLLRELKWAETASSGPLPSSGAKRGRAALVATVAALAGLLLGFALKSVVAPARPRAAVRVTIPTPPMTRMVRPAIAISRNGERIAFLARDRIWIRDLRQLDAHPVPGTEGAESPFFSPDGEWLGFFAGGQLHKVSLQGGLPIALTSKSVFLPRGAWWQEDDKILYCHPSSLMRVSAAGGAPETVIAAERVSQPQILPGGRAVLYTSWRSRRES